MHFWHGAVHAECSADSAGGVGYAACINCGQYTLGEYYAFWDVSEHGQSNGGGGDSRGDGGIDADALRPCSGGTMGAGSSPGAGGRKTGSKQPV